MVALGSNLAFFLFCSSLVLPLRSTKGELLTNGFDKKSDSLGKVICQRGVQPSFLLGSCEVGTWRL